MCWSYVQVNVGMRETSEAMMVRSEKKIEIKINLVEIMKESTVLWFGGVRPVQENENRLFEQNLS